MSKKKKKGRKKKKKDFPTTLSAHTVIRTQDLVITSDALYQLSHASFGTVLGTSKS